MMFLSCLLRVLAEFGQYLIWEVQWTRRDGKIYKTRLMECFQRCAYKIPIINTYLLSIYNLIILWNKLVFKWYDTNKHNFI